MRCKTNDYLQKKKGLTDNLKSSLETNISQIYIEKSMIFHTVAYNKSSISYPLRHLSLTIDLTLSKSHSNKSKICQCLGP